MQIAQPKKHIKCANANCASKKLLKRNLNCKFVQFVHLVSYIPALGCFTYTSSPSCLHRVH